MARFNEPHLLQHARECLEVVGEFMLVPLSKMEVAMFHLRDAPAWVPDSPRESKVVLILADVGFQGPFFVRHPNAEFSSWLKRTMYVSQE